MAPRKTQLPAVPAQEAEAPSKKGASSAVKYYLIAYNVVSALSWAYILVVLTLHILGVSFVSSSSAAAAAARPLSASARIASFLRPFSKAASTKARASAAARVQEKLLQPLLHRASTTYAVIGPETTLVQTLALLEVLHAGLGWVRSPVQTTAAQVASRIFLVWGVVERFESARSSPLYASMVFAWSLTEVIRYSFYAFSLISTSSPPHPLLWLRYTTFLVLYPLGAGSEAFVNFATLPRSSPIPTSGLNAWLKGNLWSPYDYLRGLLFLVWWPGLYFMYTYMVGQRRRVLGDGFGKKLGGKPKSL
ncbi:hypothetical protein ACEPAH_6981 [Sanghuangporus vaninii]